MDIHGIMCAGYSHLFELLVCVTRKYGYRRGFSEGEGSNQIIQFTSSWMGFEGGFLNFYGRRLMLEGTFLHESGVMALIRNGRTDAAPAARRPQSGGYRRLSSCNSARRRR
jgi:hypothetical protein